ncbi:VirB4 family type IV secretion system protein [Pseudomonas guariconensis]|uniref:VirB4 family type IV secretion system protein n=1 Tax=Pseudomonas guariconensis TaxID=1288410 RepID=UPI003905EFCC
MAEKLDIHLFDSELEGLARRGYQGGMPIQLLSDAFVYEKNGRYFHTIDGRFARIWKIAGVDVSLMNDDKAAGVTACLGDVLNKYPPGSSGQFLRHTHRDIRNIIGLYKDTIHKDADAFAMATAQSIMDRQFDAALSPKGFFAKADDATVAQMRADALAELGEELDAEVRAAPTEAITREIREGRFPHVTDLYLVFMWEPEYILGKFFDSTMKTALASVGLADANSMTERTYTRHAKLFGQHCTEIEQALANYNFYPAVMTGQGLVDFHYALWNPVRSYEVPSPLYNPEIPVLEALADPNIVNSRDTVSGASGFANVETETVGWTIHDRGLKYYIRPVSVLGKPGKSKPGMLQEVMTGVEAECLITMNWSIPKPLVVATRMAVRSRLIAAKETMRIGDRETRQKQRLDLEAARAKLTSENVSSRAQNFDLSIHINLMGFDEDVLKDQAMSLERRLWNFGHQEVLRGDAVVRNSMPFNFRQTSMRLLKRNIPHLTESVTDMAPFFIEYQGVQDAAILMNNRAGQPIFVDLWGDQVATGHSLICGTTGSGKSYTFNNLLMGLNVKYRPKVWIIDKGESYESLCLVLNGNYIRLTTQPYKEEATGRIIQPTCINPFALKRDADGNNVAPELDEKFFLARMLIMMMEAGDGSGSTKSNLTKVTATLLYNALNEFYDNWLETNPKDEPRFRDFIPHLKGMKFVEQDGEALVQNLMLYYGDGPFAALFDGYLDIDWENDFTVLETQRMADSPALGVVTLALFRQIDMYSKYKLERDRKKIVAVDEAWATLSDPNAAKALSSFYRELRRYSGACLLISQTVNDFVQLIAAEAVGGGGSSAQGGILENTSHYFFLACSESDYQLAADKLAFNNEEIALWKEISSLPPLYSEVFYRIRTKQNTFYSGVFRLYSSPMTHWIASSSPEDYRMRELKARDLMEEQSLDENSARQLAVMELAKLYPYGARYGQIL